MSLYAVKNDKGEWWDFYDDDNFWDASECRQLIADGKEEAYVAAKKHGGHLVELVEAPAKVVVNEKEAELLDKFKSGREWAAGLISKYATELFMNDKTNNVVALEDRLMRAYVNGWTVEKQKRWNVKVPHTEKTLYRKHDSGVLFASIYVGPQNRANDFLFTLAEIEHYGLTDCERVEVTDDATD